MQNETTELTTTNILSLFNTNKAQRATFVEDVIAKIEAEEVEPLKIHTYLKSVEDISSQLFENKKYREWLLNAAEKHGKKFQYQNADFSIKEVGTSYNYDKCNDPELIELLQQSEAIKKKLKTRQDFLQKVPLSGMAIINEETGETYKVYPPSKSSTTAVAVSLR